MVEKLSNQMKDLSLESEKILGKSLENELNFYLNVGTPIFRIIV